MLLHTLATGILLFASGDRIARRPSPISVRPLATSINSFTVGTANVTIAGTNPTTTPSPSGSVTLTADLKNSSSGNAWNITIKSAASTFSGCTTVPLNAITASCSVTPPAGAAGTCNSVALSTTAQTLVSGTESSGVSS